VDKFAIKSGNDPGMKVKPDRLRQDNWRQKVSRRIRQSEIPIVVYAVLLGSMGLLWYLRRYDHDLASDFFSELFGAAFTLFIIDVLLVRSKTKRWKTVRDEVNYLISRTVNRLRDGVAVRSFNFSPVLDGSLPDDETTEEIRRQRSALLTEMEGLTAPRLSERLSVADLFTEDSYDYFNEKADDIWAVLNIRYSDYLDPDLVSQLINLHVELKDLCAHIRQYLKSVRYPRDRDYYASIGARGASVNILRAVAILNTLKAMGYSETADLNG
jgi:hypothetical protein